LPEVAVVAIDGTDDDWGGCICLAEVAELTAVFATGNGRFRGLVNIATLFSSGIKSREMFILPVAVKASVVLVYGNCDLVQNVGKV
jgi:hypothetical protein